MQFYAYGLTKFILKEDIEHPLSRKQNIIERSLGKWDYFSDVMWIYKREQQIQIRTVKEVKQSLRDNSEVMKTINQLVADEMAKGVPGVQESKVRSGLDKQMN